MIDFGQIGQSITDATQEKVELPVKFSAGNIYDDLSAPEIRLKNLAAAGLQKKETLGNYFGAQNLKKSASEIAKEQDAANTAEALQSFMSETKDMASAEYKKLMKDLEVEVHKQLTAPRPVDANPPSVAQAIVAALGAIADPRHAFEIGAAPFNYQAGEAQKQDKVNADQFELDKQSRKDNIDLLSSQAQTQLHLDEMAFKNKLDTLKLSKEQADKALEDFRTQQANDIKDADTYIGRINQANIPGEARRLWNLAYSKNPELALAAKGEMEATEKLLEDKWKDEDMQRSARLAKSEFDLKKAKTLLPDQQTALRISNELKTFQRDVLNPLREQAMKWNVNHLDEKWANQINESQFRMAMARASLDESIFQHGQAASEHAYDNAAIAGRDLVGRLRSVLAEKQKRLDYLGSLITLDGEDKKEYDSLKQAIRGKGGLEQQVRDAELELSKVYKSSPAPQASGTTPPNVPALHGQIGGKKGDPLGILK